MEKDVIDIREKLKQTPYISIILVAINVLLFVASFFMGNYLYQQGVLTAWGVMNNREYGRIFYSMFLHSDLNHLFNNMFILFFLGAMIEKEIGHIHFGVIYILSGLGGNIFSLLNKIVNNEIAASLGASGAIFGLDGVLLALVLFSNKNMESVTPIRVVFMIVLSLYSGFTAQSVDNAAHVGGLVVGFLLGTIFCIIRRRMKGDENL